MIQYSQVDATYFSQYDKIPMLVHGSSILTLEKIDGGLGGILLKEVQVEPFIKDLAVYERATGLAERFDISHWAFFMAFDGDLPVGGVMVAAETPGVHMLAGRSDMSVLWDIRVDERYQGQGVGTRLFNLAVEWSEAKGYKQMKIECQNNNPHACRFYRKQGVVLGMIDEYAYYLEPEVRHEVQLIWYLDLAK